VCSNFYISPGSAMLSEHTSQGNSHAAPKAL
jgi:hypothetical protein